MDSASPSKLAQLREMSVVVADTGDHAAVARLRPVDCTTNPTIVRKALDLPVYAELIDAHVRWGRQQLDIASADVERVAAMVADRLAVGVGVMLSGLIPGRVSTEVDADLAHDTEATAAKARQLIAMYEALGVGRQRVLIKIAATWAGIRASEQLQREGIDCNLTLVFNRSQALACAEAGAFLISPFVGRILDWHVARGEIPASIEEDPGVRFVRDVHADFKRCCLATVVMGASFRSVAQIEALAGCDRLTISPDLLAALDRDFGPLPRRLMPSQARLEVPAAAWVDADAYRAAMSRDEMASTKLAEGIAAFADDLIALRTSIAARLVAA